MTNPHYDWTLEVTNKGMIVPHDLFNILKENYFAIERVREILDFNMKDGDYETLRVLDSIIDEINEALNGEHSHNYNNTTVTTGES